MKFKRPVSLNKWIVTLQQETAGDYIDADSRKPFPNRFPNTVVCRVREQPSALVMQVSELQSRFSTATPNFQLSIRSKWFTCQNELLILSLWSFVLFFGFPMKHFHLSQHVDKKAIEYILKLCILIITFVVTMTIRGKSDPNLLDRREKKKKQFSMFAGPSFHIVFWKLQDMNTFCPSLVFF